jgi:hypothetical protein
MVVVEEIPTYMSDAAELKQTAAQAVVNVTNVVMNFDTITFDNTGGAMPSTGTASKMTCVTDGLHSAYASVRYDTHGGAAADPATEFYLALQVNGVVANRRAAASGCAYPPSLSLSVSMVINLIAGDYVQAILFQACGQSRNTDIGLNNNRFVMYRMGPSA